MNKKYTRKRSQRLTQAYGINVSQWNRLYALQKGMCPICLKAILRPGDKKGRRAAAVDHDHASGRVRGLLHFRCNRYRVGANTLETAKRLVEYLASDVDGRTL